MNDYITRFREKFSDKETYANIIKHPYNKDDIEQFITTLATEQFEAGRMEAQEQDRHIVHDRSYKSGFEAGEAELADRLLELFKAGPEEMEFEALAQVTKRMVQEMNAFGGDACSNPHCSCHIGTTSPPITNIVETKP